jgi:hypothetical protein
MDIWLLVFGFAAIAVATWLFLVALKVPSQSILFSRQYAQEFRETYKGRFGTIVMVANFFGTLTSLATVYIFFLGTSKIFGGYIFAAPLTIFLGYFVTNKITESILLKNHEYARSLKDSDTISAVIAKISWTSTYSGKSLSNIVKWVSLLSIAGVIWLEFSIFADLAGEISGLSDHSIALGSSALFVCAFVVIYIIFRYGLRGFVFADLLQGPIILIGSIILFAAIIYILSFRMNNFDSEVPVFTPLATPLTLGLFVVHVFVLNLAFVLVTEGHWFRLWLFDTIETTGQKMAVVTTSLTWALLALIGCLAVGISANIGNAGVVDLLRSLSELHPILVFVFWVVASAALFSTADAQLFHLILVRNFDHKSGNMSGGVNRPVRPVIHALVAAAGMSAFYALVRYLDLPFEKLVFSITPLCANILPSLVASVTNRPAPLTLTVLSLLLYAFCSVIGIIQHDSELAWTLAAACVPVIFSALVLVTSKPSAGQASAT